ncbi:MAG: hypothetical protein ACE5HW_00040 [Candidatus Methanofastidiosia archaeon]
MKLEEKKTFARTISVAIIWASVLLGCANILNETEYFKVIETIIGGAVFMTLVIVSRS